MISGTPGIDRFAYLHSRIADRTDRCCIVAIRFVGEYLNVPVADVYAAWERAADQRKMAADPMTQAWWKLTDPCQTRLPTAKDGEWWASMDEVFFLGER